MKIVKFVIFQFILLATASAHAHSGYDDEYFLHGYGGYRDYVDDRQANQQWRIERGVRNGRLTPREARKLNRQQDRIAELEYHLKSDGWLTADEQWLLQRKLDEASKRIYRYKHNDRYAPWDYGHSDHHSYWR